MHCPGVKQHVRSSSFTVLLCAALLACLTACRHGSGGVAAEPDCEPSGALRVVCGIQAPEDLALLPDRSGLLLSEFGGVEGGAGRITLFDLAGETTQILYDAQSAADLRLVHNSWGDPDCEQGDQFSPHGIDLARRPSGRWQLLVVNHAGRESVEMFELLHNEAAGWSLDWRGCALAPGSAQLNDVAATGRGFVASQMYRSASRWQTLVDLVAKRDNGKLWQWDLQYGFAEVENLAGVSFNGVVSDNTNKRFYVNAWGEGKMLVYDRIAKRQLQELDVPHGDNNNWDVSRPGKLLVASQRANLLTMAGCLRRREQNCGAAFSIIELDTESMQQRELFRADGKYFGGGTATLRVGDTLYIGSFTGQRLLIAPVGYGVSTATKADVL